jgi:CDP-diacylglycerol pyrophosphatase
MDRAHLQLGGQLVGVDKVEQRVEDVGLAVADCDDASFALLHACAKHAAEDAAARLQDHASV